MTPGRLLRIVRHRLRSIGQRSRLDADMARELELHFEQLVLEYRAEGLSHDDARRAARRAFGNVAVVGEQCRDQRGIAWLDDLRQDVRYGLRMLAKHPVFTAVAVLSLALGIGSNTAVLGVMDAVLRSPLPLPHADRLVAIGTMPSDDPARLANATIHDYFAWRERSRAFDAVEVSLSGPRDLGPDDGDRPVERVTASAVSPGWFATLGVRPILGRVPADADADPGAHVVVISHRLWLTRYGGDANIIGRHVRVDGVTRTVLGVLSADFRFHNARVECWIPQRFTPGPGGPARLFAVTARLRPGTTIAEAQADLDAIASQLAHESPERHRGWGVRVRPLGEALYGWTREPLVTLWCAAALVLLIACANVAALLLARAGVRHREITLRVALGAGRGRIVRQLLTESVVLALAGGAAGVFVAWWGVQGLVALGPPVGAPPMASMGLNLSILAMTAGIALISGVSFGLAPALAASRLDPIAPLKETDAAPPAGGRQIARTALVAAQIALSLILAIGSGLLVKSFVRLAHRDLGFEPHGLLTFELRVPAPLRQLGLHRGQPYFEVGGHPSRALTRVLERLRAVPGVASAAGISYSPIHSLIVPAMAVAIDGAEGPARSGETPRAAYFLVTPGFFATMGTRVVRGREIEDRDASERPWVAIVNEAAAQRFWPGQDPIGRRLRLDLVPDEPPREVVGVVRNIPITRNQIDPQPAIYTSYLQQPGRYGGSWGGMFGHMMFAARTAGDPLALGAAVRHAVAQVEPDRPVAALMSGEQRVDLGIDRVRYRTMLAGVLALTAVLLAAIGVYGMLAYSVGQRSREIGIRKTLGAGARELIVLVGRRAMAIVAVGFVCGWAGALALTRLMASQLWGVAPTDPATFAGVSLLLLAVAALACLGPARQALSIDPAGTLRAE